MRVAVLTVSDRRSRGEARDDGGPAVADAAERLLPATVVERQLVADDRVAVADRLRTLARYADLVLTTGGTGLATRDVTPEATRDVIRIEVPGLAEWMRLRSAETVPAALLSRAVAGVRDGCVILNLPGSPRGAVECLEHVASALPHAVAVLTRPGEDVHEAEDC